MQHFELNEHEIANLYAWIDSATFSRPKKNLTRDFSDGVACAELIHNFLPKFVDLHNYSPANSISQKIYNWHTLNSKVFKRLDYSTTSDIINCIVHMRPGYIEYLLWDLKVKITAILVANPSLGGKSAGLERKSTSSKSRPKSITSAKDPLTPTPPQIAPVKTEDLKHVDSQDRSKQVKMKSSELAVNAGMAASPPTLPKDGNADDMQETIKLLQLKVQKMSELLDLKNEKLVQLETNSKSSYSSLRK